MNEHKEWVDRVYRDLNISSIEPLWNSSPLAILEKFIKLGIKASVVSCQADKFDKDFVGKYVGKELLAELKPRNICPCSENGEFHTLVIDGPLFNKRGIQILESEPLLKVYLKKASGNTGF